jgi:hypothetical protein
MTDRVKGFTVTLEKNIREDNKEKKETDLELSDKFSNYIEAEGSLREVFGELEERESHLFVNDKGSAIYDLQKTDLSAGMIVFINGILTDITRAHDLAEMLSGFSGGKNIHYVHNVSYGFFFDFLVCVMGRNDELTGPIFLLKKTWYDFFEKDSENCILTICHSQGSRLVKKALINMRADLRERIVVLSIAGADIIPQSLCKEAHNYISKRDFIPLLNPLAWDEKYNEIHYLNPHEKAPFWDHDFDSPTYFDVMKFHINEYLSNPKMEE